LEFLAVLEDDEIISLWRLEMDYVAFFFFYKLIMFVVHWFSLIGWFFYQLIF